MMKKVLSLLLAVILLASLTLTASTAEEEVFDGYVIVRLCNEGELYYGDDIYLYASVKSANMPYTPSPGSAAPARAGRISPASMTNTMCSPPRPKASTANTAWC